MPNTKQVLIIGGGIAGLTAGHELAGLGVHVVIAEKGPFIGGHAANLACKATDRCLKCNDCLVEERLKETREENRFDIRLGTEIEGVEKNGAGFRVSLRSGPRFMDPGKCNDCGLCFEKCPEAVHGAIRPAVSHHMHPSYAIDPLNCSFLKAENDARSSPVWKNPSSAKGEGLCRDGKKGICEATCPEGAISLDENEVYRDLEVDGIVLATGYRPFDPGESRRFNFDRFGNMVTGMELERMLRKEGGIVRPSDGVSPEKLAFIQCVGSRDSHMNHDYCSRVCCGYALRMALKVVHEHPGMRISLFYMDIQNFGKDFDRFYQEAEKKIVLVRGLPGDIYASDTDHISISYYDEERQRTVSETFGMVALSVGMMPSASHPFFRDLLGLSLDRDGFLYIPDETGNQGIVIAGSAEGPMDVAESISHAKRAALETAQFLGVV